jgi:hypothetical protein
MSTVLDYAGRLVDVNAFQGWELGVGTEVLLDQELASDVSPGGEVITGCAKLIQRFLLVLLTETGSLVYLPGAGSQFMTDALGGRWRTSTDVQQSFYSALLDVKRQMRQMELPSDPDEERLDDVVIISIILSPRDRAVLRLQMYTVAGTSRTFIAPIDVAPK